MPPEKKNPSDLSDHLKDRIELVVFADARTNPKKYFF
jgi:hypothetical protein